MAENKTGMTVEIMTVTPEMAAEWLENNTQNRKLRKSVALRYATDMANGQWKLGTSAILFNGNGGLMDGQHRLLACTMAKVSFDTVVAFNVPADAKEAIDTGLRRQLSDILAWNGESQSIQLAAGIRMDWRLQNGYLFNKSMGYGIGSNAQLLGHLERNPNLRAAVSSSWELKSKLHVPASSAVAYTHRLRRIDSLEANLWFDKICSGENIASGQPAFAARSWCLNQLARQRSERPSADVFLAILIKAWNSYVKGDQVQLLAFRRGTSQREDFPKILDLEGDPVELVDEVKA